MAKILTLEDVKNKVFKNTLNTCEYISGYENSKSYIKIKCLKHNYIFQTKWENVRRDTRPHHVCPYCQEEDKNNKYNQNRTIVKCAYCNKEFIKNNSSLKNSKSGLFFCCREHKDLAQKINAGESFKSIRPAHYKNGIRTYRENAFFEYPHQCAVCSWKEDEDVLEVHHIDENRENNNINNLIILCPICHKKLTTHKYQLINRNIIIKIK